MSATSAPGSQDATQESNVPMLRVRELKKHFPLRRRLFGKQRIVRAVDGISFDVEQNQTVGLVGESGCGKTTAGRTILRLLEPTSGSVHFRDHNVFELSPREMRALRRKMQVVFQDPYSSLNPRMTVESIVGDAMQVHGIARGDEMRKRVAALLERVGLQPSYASRYPHEFSGGQRQRIGIARALALEPEFIVCDEAVSALDVSVQAQVINLLEDLQSELKLSYLFIAHDLSVVRHISDVICVMYLGEIVERAATADLFGEPLHPYTQALLSAIPKPQVCARRSRIVLEGDVPSPIDPPSGCRFHTRCPLAFPTCAERSPTEISLGNGHVVRCHLYDRELSRERQQERTRAHELCLRLREDTQPGEEMSEERGAELFGTNTRPGEASENNGAALELETERG